jgi:phosphonate transport system ATP-binding protein
LIEPTEGRVIWNGTDVTALSGDELRKIRRQIGMIFQQFNLVKRSSVMTNVLSGRLGYVNPWRSALGRFPKQDVAKAWKALETVGILDQANKRADELSGGQQQRVGIARALMQDPQLLLADEPVASLDPATSHSILKYLEQLNRGLGVTVLCSLHFLSLARAYGTRLIALKDGGIVFEGLPAEIDDDKFRDIYGQEAVQVEIR